MKRIISLLVLSSAGLFAQPEASPDQLKAATDLTTTMGIDKQLGSGFDSMMPMIVNMGKRMQLDDAGQAELLGIYKSWFNEDIDQTKIKATIIKLYAEMFTKEELTQLNEFYKSPLGQKTLVALPELTKRSSAVGMEQAMGAQAKLQERLMPFMAKHQPPAPAAGGTPAPGPAPMPTPAPAPALKK